MSPPCLFQKRLRFSLYPFDAHPQRRRRERRKRKWGTLGEIPMMTMIATSKLALAQQKQNIHSTTRLFHYIDPTSLFYQPNNKCHRKSMSDTGNFVKADLDDYTQLFTPMVQ